MSPSNRVTRTRAWTILLDLQTGFRLRYFQKTAPPLNAVRLHRCFVVAVSLRFASLFCGSYIVIPFTCCYVLFSGGSGGPDSRSEQFQYVDVIGNATASSSDMHKDGGRVHNYDALINEIMYVSRAL